MIMLPVKTLMTVLSYFSVGKLYQLITKQNIKANWVFSTQIFVQLKYIIIIGKNFKYLSNYKLLLNI